MSETPQPPDTTAEYSGPAAGDERDPKRLGEIIPDALEEIRRHAEDPALFTARAQYIDLANRDARGETVSDADLAAARERLTLEEERARSGEFPGQ